MLENTVHLEKREHTKPCRRCTRADMFAVGFIAIFFASGLSAPSDSYSSIESSELNLKEGGPRPCAANPTNGADPFELPQAHPIRTTNNPGPCSATRNAVSRVAPERTELTLRSLPRTSRCRRSWMTRGPPRAPAEVALTAASPNGTRAGAPQEHPRMHHPARSESCRHSQGHPKRTDCVGFRCSATSRISTHTSWNTLDTIRRKLRKVF